MESVAATPNIRESFLEHRQSFATSWVDRWVLPNPFIKELHHVLKDLGVELVDFSFNREATSVGDTFLNVAIRRLNAAAKIGLDSVTFSAANPDWGDAPRLVSLFDSVASTVCETVQAAPAFQETTLVLHITSDTVDFRTATASLVNRGTLGEAAFYGITRHRADGSLMIDKSVRYEGGVFVRIQRKSLGEDSFAKIASRIYEDEVSALALLGLTGNERGNAQ